MKKNEKELQNLVKRQEELQRLQAETIARIETLKSGLVWAVIEGVDTRKMEEELASLETRLQAVGTGLPVIREQIRELQDENFKGRQQETQKELETLDVQLTQVFREGLQHLSQAVNTFDDFNTMYREGAKKAGSVRLSFVPGNNLVSYYNLYRQALTPFIKSIVRNKKELVSGIDFTRFREIILGVEDGYRMREPELHLGGYYRDPITPSVIHEVDNPIKPQNRLAP